MLVIRARLARLAFTPSDVHSCCAPVPEYFTGTQFEGWCAMQRATPQGLKPAQGAKRRCTIYCIHNATKGAEDVKMYQMWAARTPMQAHEVLSSPDVMVTNQKDKDVQLEKIQMLDASVCSAFNEGSAAKLRAANVAAEDLRVGGFELQVLYAAGYTVAELRAAGYNARELATAGVSARALRDGGVLPREMTSVGVHLREAYTVEELASMAEAGGGCTMLYAVGGDDGDSYLRSVERYDPTADEWTAVAPMGTGRACAGVATVNGMLFVVGGYHGGGQLSSVERYDAKDLWTAAASMRSRRAYVSVAAVGGTLFAVGGYADGQQVCAAAFPRSCTRAQRRAGRLRGACMCVLHKRM